MRFPIRRLLGLFLAGLAVGLLGEGVLLMRAHCLRAEFLLLEDFRIVAFLASDAGEGRRRLVEEKLRAMPATEEVRYVSPQESLAEIEAEHPDIGRSVALLGDNPLSGAFEAQIRPERLSQLEAWLKAAENIPGIEDILYKPLQAQTIAQVQFYSRFLSLVLSLAACVWAFGVAWVLWASGRWRAGERPAAQPQEAGSVGEAIERGLVCGTGVALGAGAVLALALPAASAGLRAWPAAWLQAWLVLSGALAGALFARIPPPGKVFGERPFLFFRRAVKSTTSVAAALLLLSAASRAFSAALPDKREELKELNQTLENKKKQLETIRQRESELHKNLSDLNAQKSRSQRVIRDLESRREETRRKTDLLSGRLDALEHTHGGERAALAGELADYAKQARMDFGCYGTGDLWVQSLRRAALLEKTAYLGQLGIFRSRTVVEHEKARREDEALRRRTRAAHAALSTHRTRLQVTEKEYRQARQAVSLTRRQIREIEESARALADLIRNLERSRASARKGARTGKTPPVAKHSLPWPVAGELLSGFGKERSRELNTWIIRNGIEIAAGLDASVLPVARGKVIFSGPFRSYGNTIILDHGGGFYSIYGRLGSLMRHKGESVGAGEPLARAGTEDGEGRVYLELRQGDQALNPVVWLRKR